MSLTVGTGPFGPRPAGRFNFAAPAHVVYVEPLGRRLRAERHGQVVIDTEDALLIHESGSLARYALPDGEVRATGVTTTPEPLADGFVGVPWDAVDAWYEEEERVEVHPIDPYHRIDTFATSRRVTVSLEGVTLADSSRARALYETGLPVRWYLPAGDLDHDRLVPSDTVTRCAYKGTARHLSARIGDRLVPDVAWSYGHAELRRDGEPVAGLIAFYDERVDIDLDGRRQERPRTRWSQDC